MIRRRCSLALALGLALPALAADEAAPFDHVVIVAVDGLRSDALLVDPATMPHLTRLRDGAGTLNARTDPHFTVTMPNHSCMVTGRGVLGDDGHGCLWNQMMRTRPILHQPDRYVHSVFCVAHDHGLATGLFVTKLKLALLDSSWDGEHGAPDTVPPDHGRDKVDRFVYVNKKEHPDTTAAATDALLAFLATAPARSVSLVHYRHPDATGHADGWNLTKRSPYLESIVHVDLHVGRLLDVIESSDHLRDRTAVILTSDHGGGAPYKNHGREDLWVNYVIPFFVWTGDREAPVDLYAANPTTRRDPGLGRPPADADLPPIRNGDAANVALHLLGLPPVPGSTINAKQDLRVRSD